MTIIMINQININFNFIIIILLILTITIHFISYLNYFMISINFNYHRLIFIDYLRLHYFIRYY